MIVWQVRTVRVQTDVRGDMENLNEILAEGWEPFSASASPVGHIFYLRQRVSTKDF